MHHMIFVNLPVADVERSREFFGKLGYSFNEEFCQEGVAASLALGENLFAMLLSRDHFATFHSGATAEPGTHEVLTALSANSRGEVDQLVDAAVAAGATEGRTQEMGEFMYGRSYADLDGHIWEIMWMDPTAAA
ncbi:VOC family protein [Cumulibacter soli]|uniref:VOC family protein n=1 Tax=Cumulibacter soli TaxID=2546344 RepID=UPI0010685510|nr:VOC family protein [Cumulibacter soli]